jgi:hypothetical protein
MPVFTRVVRLRRVADAASRTSRGGAEFPVVVPGRARLIAALAIVVCGGLVAACQQAALPVATAVASPTAGLSIAPPSAGDRQSPVAYTIAFAPVVRDGNTLVVSGTTDQPDDSLMTFTVSRVYHLATEDSTRAGHVGRSTTTVTRGAFSVRIVMDEGDLPAVAAAALTPIDTVAIDLTVCADGLSGHVVTNAAFPPAATLMSEITAAQGTTPVLGQLEHWCW